MANNFTLVEDVLSIYDDRFWYYIPNFNGYELSDDNYIRSMKHYKKYPFGLLIQPKKNSKGDIISPNDPIYELSNNNNERVSIKLSQIKHLAYTNNRQITGYPRRTCTTDISSRNQRCFIKKKVHQNSQFNTERFIPKFNIIKDNYNEIICPVESISNKGEYYGRKDSRTFSYIDV